jgi:putative FmdB family regulatory protein
MPTYGFRCPDGHAFDRFYKTISTAPGEVACPECGKTAARQLHGGAGLLFKGSGFYLTDYGKNAHRPKTEGKADIKSDAGADTKTDTKTEAKADTKADSKSDTKADRKADTRPDTKPGTKAKAESSTPKAESTKPQPATRKPKE